METARGSIENNSGDNEGGGTGGYTADTGVWRGILRSLSRHPPILWRDWASQVEDESVSVHDAYGGRGQGGADTSTGGRDQTAAGRHPPRPRVAPTRRGSAEMIALRGAGPESDWVGGYTSSKSTLRLAAGGLACLCDTVRALPSSRIVVASETVPSTRIRSIVMGELGLAVSPPQIANEEVSSPRIPSAGRLASVRRLLTDAAVSSALNLVADPERLHAAPSDGDLPDWLGGGTTALEATTPGVALLLVRSLLRVALGSDAPEMCAEVASAGRLYARAIVLGRAHLATFEEGRAFAPSAVVAVAVSLSTDPRLARALHSVDVLDALSCIAALPATAVAPIVREGACTALAQITVAAPSKPLPSATLSRTACILAASCERWSLRPPKPAFLQAAVSTRRPISPPPPRPASPDNTKPKVSIDFVGASPKRAVPRLSIRASNTGAGGIPRTGARAVAGLASGALMLTAADVTP